MKVPASLVLRLISLILVIIGLSLMSYSGAQLLSDDVISNPYTNLQLTLGTLLLLLGFIGPVRIIYNGAQVPAEIQRTIIILAITIPLSGLCLFFAGMMGEPMYSLCAYFCVGLLIVLSVLVGFYPLSKRFPSNFYIGEMLSIIKSAGIAGDKESSPADQAMMRWTTGREGVAVGSKAPNGTVITMQGEEVQLSSFFGKNPLVLNFGSYSCPHHRKRINELLTLMNTWQHQNIDFLTVYTAEAHTEDGWKLANQYVNDAEYTNEDDFCFSYATTIDERRHMAEWLIKTKHFDMPLVLDTMQDTLLKAYNSWPIRLYVIHESKVVYCGDQGPFGYEPSSVDAVLKKLRLC